MAIPAKIAGLSTWLVALIAVIVVYVGYRNYDNNGSVFDFTA